MDPLNGMRLWWASHMWASDGEKGGRSDLLMVMANLGPVGFWSSLPLISEISERQPPIVLLSDLRISKKSIASMLSTISFSYQQYHVIVTSFSASEWEKGI
eukprot:2682173-Rhodomonas_salina.1